VRSRLSDRQLLAALRECAEQLGAPPTQRQVDANREAPSAATYRRRFGSWTRALKAAGFPPRSQARLDREEILDRFQDTVAALGGFPTEGQFPVSRATIERHFEGGVGEVRRLLGFIATGRRRVDPALLLAKARRRIGEAGALRLRDLDVSRGAVRNHFGSLGRLTALARRGLEDG
jgi:integrase